MSEIKTFQTFVDLQCKLREQQFRVGDYRIVAEWVGGTRHRVQLCLVNRKTKQVFGISYFVPLEDVAMWIDGWECARSLQIHVNPVLAEIFNACLDRGIDTQAIQQVCQDGSLFREWLEKIPVQVKINKKLSDAAEAIFKVPPDEQQPPDYDELDNINFD